MLAWQPGLSLWKMYYYFTLRKKVRILYVLKAEKKSKLWKRGKLKVYYQIRDGCVLILSTQSPILHFPLKSLRESPYERQDPRTRWSYVPVHHYTKYSLLLLKKIPLGLLFSSYLNTVYENTDFLHRCTHDLWTVTS